MEVNVNMIIVLLNNRNLCIISNQALLRSFNLFDDMKINPNETVVVKLLTVTLLIYDSCLHNV